METMDLNSVWAAGPIGAGHCLVLADNGEERESDPGFSRARDGSGVLSRWPVWSGPSRVPHTRVRSQGLREEGPRPCPPVASPGGWCRPASSWKEWRPLPRTNVRFRLAALVTSAEFTDPFWTWLSLPLPSTPNSLTGQVTGRVICSSDPGVETWKQADSFAV